MNDSQLMHAMSLDDTYRVEQVLARGITLFSAIVYDLAGRA